MNELSPRQSPPYDRRIGRFSIAYALIQRQPDMALAVLSGCLVVRAEMLYSEDAVEYVALHRDFAPVEPGVRAPCYRCTLVTHRDGSCEVTWQPEQSENANFP